MFKPVLYLLFAIFLTLFFTGYMIASSPPINSKPINQDNFSIAVKVILRHEGKFSDNKHDLGGATMYGISLRLLKTAGIDIDLDGDINIHDILAINKEEAISLYKTLWWNQYHYNEIDSLPVATKIFDLAINMGASEAHKIVQRAANKLGYELVVDGILGSKTLIIINILSKLHQTEFINAINKEAKEFYYLLVEKNPELGIFLKGWLHRVNDSLS